MSAHPETGAAIAVGEKLTKVKPQDVTLRDNSDVQSVLVDVYADIQDARTDRDAAQARVNEALAKGEALGVTKKAMKLAINLAEMDQSKRDRFFLELGLVLRAMGVKYQLDLFSVDETGAHH